MTRIQNSERSNHGLEVKYIQDNIDPERNVIKDEIKQGGLYDLRQLNE